MNIELRRAQSADIGQIVDVHLESFQGFFLSMLGRGFLRVFYDSLRSVERGILIVASIEGEVVGFVGGATDQDGLYRSMLQERRLEFVGAAVIAAVRHPSSIPRLLRARMRARGQIEYLPGASLMTLGVATDHERKGIGRSLVGAFSRALEADGIPQFSLTTDAVDNEGANRFYLSLGFVLERELITPEGRRLNEYVRQSG